MAEIGRTLKANSKSPSDGRYKIENSITSPKASVFTSSESLSPRLDTPGAPPSSFMLDRKQMSKSLPRREDHDSDVVYEESDVQALAIPLESIPDNTSSSGVAGAQRYQEMATDASNQGPSSDKINQLVDAIEMGLNSFFDGMPELIKALDEVANLYPFISVVVVAFKAVCALESSRRYNDRKVIALYVEMRDMIATLVDLRAVEVKKIDMIYSNGQTIRDRLKELSTTTAEDIISFANTCEAYSKKKLVVKVFSGPIWENKLSEFVRLFTQRKKEFILALSNGDDGLDAEARAQEINEKILAMERIFHKLASSEQKQVVAFIELKGGRACLKNETAMRELVDYEAKISVTQKPELSSHGLNAKQSDKLVELRREVDEKPAQATEKNFELFRRKFEIQKRQIENAMVVNKVGYRIISAIYDAPCEGVAHPQLYVIWKEMNWHGSVKVKHFIIALRDFYSNKALSNNDLPVEDRWALQYISLSKLQTIVEAVDDEVSGFMTIAQANRFAQARPTFWSLPRWIAYWAAGWQVTAADYCKKIDGIVARMLHLQAEVRPENSSAVDQYLHSIWDSVVTLTSSLQQSDDSESLRTRFVSYVNAEEDKMRENLEHLRYRLDGYDAVSVVTGSMRIETVVLPLLYLILNRHLAIIKVGRTHVLGTQELPDALQTWLYVARMAALRVSQLQEIFKQQNLDVHSRFKTFAHGLFGHVNEFGFVASATTRTMLDPLDHNGEDEIEDPEHVLSYPVRTDDSAFYPPYEQPPIRKASHWKTEPETISGLWYCLLYIHSNAFYPMTSFIMFQSTTDNSTFSASGKQIIWSKIESYIIQGHTGEMNNGITDVNFELKYLEDGATIAFDGELDSIGGSVQGKWRISDSKHGHFVLKRSPEHLRFRPAPVAILESPARARWRFALNAAHDRAKRNLWSWSFFRGRFQDRRRYVELARGRTRYDSGLDSTDYFDLTTLHQRLHPADIQFYTSLVTSSLKNLSPSNNIFTTRNRVHGTLERQPWTALTSAGTGEGSHHSKSDSNSDSAFLRLLSELNSSSALSRLSHDESVSLIERAEKAMISPTCDDATRDKCFRLLRRLCGKTGVLPLSCSIQEGLQTVGDHALMSGGFADVWQGVYHGKTVAIKVIRLYRQEDVAKAQKRFCKEVVTWKYLSHPNILRFVGVSTSSFKFSMVSDWMENGNITDYLRRNPHSDRGKFALDVTHGLGYLHSKNVLHGDLKGANILVNDNLQACLADFGLATAAQDMHDFSATTSTGHGSLRWMAPELFDPEEFGLKEPARTKESDVYSLGMVILEIFTGKSPFAEIQTDARVMRTVLSGIRPKFAVDLGVSEELWRIMEDCWKQQPTERPPVSKIIPRIESERTLTK